jgi:hypothetical protein
MRSVFRQGAITGVVFGAILGAMPLALIGVVGFAVANQVIEQDLSAVPLGPTFPDDETTGSIDRSAVTQGLPLSDEQRGFIFLGVINLPDVPDVDIAMPDVPSPGPLASLPETVDLQDLPAMVVRKIPLLRDHKFVKLDDRILVVRPTDRTVVSEIPRFRILP